MREILDALIDKFLGIHLPDDASALVRRAGRRMALIAAAGELATNYGLTGWQTGHAIEMVGKFFEAWVNCRGGKGDAMPGKMIAQVRAFLEAHGESRFSPMTGDPDHRPTVNRAGFRKGDGYDSTEYFVLPEAWKELCKGFDPNAVARTLHQTGALSAPGPGKHLQTRWVLPGLGRRRCYQILPAIWEIGAAEENADEE